MSQVTGPCSYLYTYSRERQGWALSTQETVPAGANSRKPLQGLAYQFTVPGDNAPWTIPDQPSAPKTNQMRWESLLDHSLFQVPHRNVYTGLYKPVFVCCQENTAIEPSFSLPPQPLFAHSLGIYLLQPGECFYLLLYLYYH